MPAIARTFRDLSEKDVADIQSASTLARMGWSGDFGWDELLKSSRILIVSEAGAGKTFECRGQQEALWFKGEPAFFLELAALSREDVKNLLSADEETRFNAWLRAQSETATFFLNSIDELGLTLGSFDQALKRLGKALAGQLGRARIVITTRPIPVDQQIIQRHLPIPPTAAEVSAEAFADHVMSRDQGQQQGQKNDGLKPWRNVGLMPLSKEQIRAMAVLECVADPDAMLADIQRGDAEEFTQRPQDLIELCADWRDHQRIRTHREQVESNIETKLKPRTDRREKAQLAPDRAMEGASRIALAAVLTRKLTLRYSAESDTVALSEAALDPSKILTNWVDLEQATLLERSLFGFATYGRVRFHHRSVIEYLAARRLDALLGQPQPVPIKSVKRLLFTKTAQGENVVRPSMRPVAAWLSLWRDSIYEEVRDREPAVLLNYGDPQSLRPNQRVETLKAYVERFGKGGWRGHHISRIQVHRFASCDLGPTVASLWSVGIENREVRDLILEFIEAGKLTDCADIAYSRAIDPKVDARERISALDALVALDDPRLPQLAEATEADTALWPDGLVRSALLSLFPKHLGTDRLCRILRRVREPNKSVGDLSWQLPRLIEDGGLRPASVEELRDGLTELVASGAEWNKNKWPHVQAKRPDLLSSLMVACILQFRSGLATQALLRSSVLALRFSKEDHIRDEPTRELRQHLANASSAARETAFWAGDAFFQGLHAAQDAWHRLYALTHQGAITLIAHKDRKWIRTYLSDPSKEVAEREMMLYAEMIDLPHESQTYEEHIQGLKAFVSDSPYLLGIIDNRLKPPQRDAELQRMDQEHAERQREQQREEAEAHNSWVEFWQEIANNPDTVFGPDRAENTAWNLWRAMAPAGYQSRASGWNRRFIEQQFDKDVADRLRATLMAMWRKDTPTLRSERPESEKNTTLLRWQLGLAAIAAEAEDPQWASKLSDQEARLAARYAPLELNGFPSWLEALIEAHPSAVDAVLGQELSLTLREPLNANDHPIFLQNIRHASAGVAALFVPRIRAWLGQNESDKDESENTAAERRLAQAIDVLQRSGDIETAKHLEALATRELAGGLNGPLVAVWFPILLQLNPAAGVDALSMACGGNNLKRTRHDFEILQRHAAPATGGARGGSSMAEMMMPPDDASNRRNKP